MQPVPEYTLEFFYRSHHKWLYGLLQRHLGCSETAAELAQDTFLRLLIRHQDLKQIDEPRAYLSRIARCLLANHWRRCDIERAYLEVLSQQPEKMEPSPETRHAIIETLYRIDAMLQDLPAKVRQAFLLSRLEDVRYADIAKTLKVSERMVKKYMAQAMLHCLRLEDDFLL